MVCRQIVDEINRQYVRENFNIMLFPPLRKLAEIIYSIPIPQQWLNYNAMFIKYIAKLNHFALRTEQW